MSERKTRRADTDDGISSESFPPKPGRLQRPVTWLLGSNLLRQVGWIALNSLFGRRLGGGVWMRAEPLTVEREEYEKREDENEQAFWFDYISDSGDSQRATYSIAYLCLSDLWIDDGTSGVPVHFDDAPDRLRLPRGQFLFVGGDAAYHVSNYRTLLQRFRNPFCWAHKDLVDRGRASASRKGRLYAIPGNHDYYDSLQGFNRQFRRPVEGEGRLVIPCFERMQEASYLAVELPFDWWFLGMDTQDGNIDRRQRVFFKRLLEDKAPQKLILATSEPGVVFDRPAPDDAAIVRSLSKVEPLTMPFRDEPPTLPEGHCRLDIAGDVHTYARYWGADDVPSYASVVSGLGGAFLQPTHTALGTLRAKKKFPSEDTSRRVINSRLLQVYPIMRGGNIAVLGVLIGLVLFFAWRVKDTSKVLVQAARGIERLYPGELPGPQASVAAEAGSAESIVRFLGLASAGFWSLMLGAVGAVLAAVSLRRHARQSAAGVEDVGRPYTAYLGFLLIAAAPFTANLPWMYQTPESFTQSVILFVFTVLGVLGVFAAVWHREILDERAKHSSVTRRDDLLSLGIAKCGFLSMAGAFSSYGQQPVRMVALHLAFLAVILLCTLGLVLYAVLVGAGGRTRSVKIWFGVLGVWHGVLQLGVPLLWAHQGPAWAVLLYVPVLLVMNYAGYLVARCKATVAMQAGLTLLWLILGAASLAIPLMLAGEPPRYTEDPSLLHALFVAALTSVLSCVWFGWYLAVALAFHGHNTEAGAAARIDDFVELVRIKVTPEGLTAYVIGIEAPEEDGAKLRPRLMDVFTLKVQGAAARTSRADAAPDARATAE